MEIGQIANIESAREKTAPSYVYRIVFSRTATAPNEKHAHVRDERRTHERTWVGDTKSQILYVLAHVLILTFHSARL